MLNLKDRKYFNFYLKIILFCIYFFGFLSCRVTLSSQVQVEMLGSPSSLVPIVFYKGNENALCRKGLPDNYYLPWDEENTEDSENEERIDEVQTSVDDFWFRFYPVIDNESSFYLVITELRIKIFRGGEQVAQEEFTEGWCNTSPLYFFEPKGGGEHKSYTAPYHINMSFVKGNLWFYVGGLEQDQQQDTGPSRSFQEIKISEYSVEWQMLGYFALENGRTVNEEGEQIGGFQKTGSFTVLPSSF